LFATTHKTLEMRPMMWCSRTAHLRLPLLW